MIKFSVATPADWKQQTGSMGEDVIVVPALSTEDAERNFRKGLKRMALFALYTPNRSELMIKACHWQAFMFYTGKPSFSRCATRKSVPKLRRLAVLLFKSIIRQKGAISFNGLPC